MGSKAANSRAVRVFLSSTFRDFAEERDLLVRKVFPELRRMCRERQIELVDVDLRWGITEEEAQQGKVLPICLAEIDRSHMGKIERGERNVTFLNILRIAKAMQCRPSDLLIDAGL